MMSMPAEPHSRFLFVSSNSASWGGSEELWSAAAATLAEAGHTVSVLKPNLDESQPRIRRLRALSCRVRALGRVPFLSRFSRRPVTRRPNALAIRRRALDLTATLTFAHVDLVVISQGANLDGIYLGSACRRMNKAYVLIAQKATDAYWPADESLSRIRAVYSEARACFFVSDHNRRLTEEQLGIDLPRAHVVRNPFLVPWERRDDWPSERDGLRLACIGRLYAAEKGQDLLIRVLSRPKWRERPLTVTFFGSGPNAKALEQMAAYLAVTSVTFAGSVNDVASIWDDHHGLLLMSRAEGLPLVLVETMLSGRVPIVTNVAGNTEVVRDGVTGFIAAAPTEDAVDEALERAWQRRSEWESIGRDAADEIRTLVPPDPAEAFASILMRVAASAVCTADAPVYPGAQESRDSGGV